MNLDETLGKQATPLDHPAPENEAVNNYTDINQILDRILQCDMSIENSKQVSINTHRMKPALFSVLCEIKEKTCLRYPHEV